MKINEIQNPLIAIDLETTGTNVNEDRIIQIGIVRYNPKALFDNDTQIKADTLDLLINPEMPISPSATEVHGITDEMVKGCKTFKDYSSEIMRFIGNKTDIVGFNHIRFDMPILYNEFARAGIDWNYWNYNFIDVGNIYKIKEPRTLESAVRYYLNQEHKDAHSALQDATATMKVLFAQLNKYTDLPQVMNILAYVSNYETTLLDLSGKFKFNENKDICFNFGQYKGEPVSEHLDYIDWMLSKDFPLDTQKVCNDILSQVSAENKEDFIF